MPEGPVDGDYRAPIDTAGLWGDQDYEDVLYGMDFLSSECDDWYGAMRPDPIIENQVVERLRAAPQMLPTHAKWLRQFCDMPDYTTHRGANT